MEKLTLWDPGQCIYCGPVSDRASKAVQRCQQYWSLEQPSWEQCFLWVFPSLWGNRPEGIKASPAFPDPVIAKPTPFPQQPASRSPLRGDCLSFVFHTLRQERCFRENKTWPLLPYAKSKTALAKCSAHVSMMISVKHLHLYLLILSFEHHWLWASLIM